MDCALPLLFLPITFLRFGSDFHAVVKTTAWKPDPLANTLALQLCVSVPIAEILAIPTRAQ
jgi:hypothetical protein